MFDHFLGKPAAFWYQVHNTLEANKLLDLAKLEARLAATDDSRIEVRDAKNPERLLGSIPRPAWSPAMRFIRMSVMQPMSIRAYSYNDPLPEDLRVTTVSLGLAFRGYTPYLGTSDELNLLVGLRDFRLPGESEMQAAERHRFR
jgi:hypothetical protein